MVGMRDRRERPQAFKLILICASSLKVKQRGHKRRVEIYPRRLRLLRSSRGLTPNFSSGYLREWLGPVQRAVVVGLSMRDTPVLLSALTD